MTTAEILRRIVSYGGVVAAVIAVIGGVIGILLSGVPGLMSAVLGLVTAALFLGVTAAGVMLALRFARGNTSSVTFLAIVLGTLLVKFGIFLVLVISVAGLSWLDSRVAFGVLVAAMIGTMIVDVIVIAGLRKPLNAVMDAEEDTLGGPARPQPGGRGSASVQP